MMQGVLGAMIVTGLCLVLMKVINEIWIKPKRIRSILTKQEIKGPKPSFLFGNIQEMKKIQFSEIKNQKSHSSIHHSWASSIFPYLHQWSQQYGKIYMYSTGNIQHLYIGEPELTKALNLHKSLNLGRPNYLSKTLKPLFGNGIIRANGHEWAHQRKLIAPEFFLHKAKHMMELMKESTIEMIRTWECAVESNDGVVDIIVDKDLKNLSADIISKACFGSSFSQGTQIFEKVDALQQSLSKPSLLFGLANFSFLPTKSNRQIWKLQKDIETLIMEIVNARRDKSQSSTKSEKDLLQAILESAANGVDVKHVRNMNRFIIDNCKNIYFAGHETSALIASWTLMLLSLHPEWQDRIRAEIVEVCGDRLHDCLIDLDKLRHLKAMTMVIHESLRLYGPGVITSREAFKDIEIADLKIPKGTCIWVLVTTLHRDPENWGADANEFRPERFANGVAEACKYPQSYMPFGFGPRLCLGQAFAMLELKIMLSLLVSNFCFSLSPEYRHSPVYKMLLAPEHGVRLLVRKVQSGD